MENLPDILTTSDVMRLLRLDRTTIRRWCNQGRLAFTRTNKRGDKQYRKEDVLRLLCEEGGESK